MDICVYCSSSDAVSPAYLEAAESLGKSIGSRGHSLIYGGAAVGSMGAVARGTREKGGRITGVMPEKLHRFGLFYDGIDERIITDTMRQRKEIMESRAESFIALPGGLGTLEEIFEVMVLKQLGYHSKAVVFIDLDGFYSPLMEFLEKLCRERFMKEGTRTQYAVVREPGAAIDYLENYIPQGAETKWFKHP
ncbi:Rossman fold protein, TIGR00730 family [Marispirochaeta aestuarii]|uniref:Cytokinin riboside 5'-monophosphate phosphoribohydrolase n=1 Tax=Marispirochaeta aestuarii TaxID=1963862 RepID=A0A1Y1RWI9_9SPIO|nr:TIGR00730 family Rossman fold protein [Marispirochaeta aestuarii]ORC34515.1 Rossman fold protein, TIGR00730 family [Marispirochaeta aestuarii]